MESLQNDACGDRRSDLIILLIIGALKGASPVKNVFCQENELTSTGGTRHFINHWRAVLIWPSSTRAKLLSTPHLAWKKTPAAVDLVSELDLREQADSLASIPSSLEVDTLHWTELLTDSCCRMLQQ